MHFRILGPLEAYAGGRQLALGGIRQRALLAVLLLHRNEVVSSDRLIEALWADSSRDEASKALQVAVSRLRKALGSGPGAGGESTPILTRPPGYELRVQSGQVDLDRFEALVSEGRAALASGAPDAAAQTLSEALGLWRGRPLADVAYESFAQADVRRLEELGLTATEDRIAADLELGRHPELIGELERLARQHPHRERIRAQLMLALYRSGRQAEALESYQDARAALTGELGIEPSRNVRELQQRILRQDPALDLPRRAPPRPAPPDARQFIGRDRELGELMTGLERASSGHGNLFLIGGQPGIGKSRLLDQLAERARGATVLWGRCWEAGGAPAYWPWIQSVRSYARSAEPEVLRSQLGVGAGEVARLVPELGELFPDLKAPPQRDPDTARFRLFEAIAGLLVAAARARPLVLILDDLHAADEPSLLLLQFIARELGAAPLLVAGAYRDSELTPGTPLASLLAELNREPSCRLLTLEGLSEREVGRLIEHTAGISPRRRSVAGIHRGTEGNPLFVGEVVRLLASEGRLTGVGETAFESLPIPPGVREVIGRRLRHLSDECRTLLGLASVLGREFGVDALAHVRGRSEPGSLDEVDEAGRSEPGSLDEVDEAVSAHVLAEVPGSPDRLRFAHALIRDTLYGELGRQRRLRLHRDVAEALEDFYAPDREPHLTELAYQFMAAGQAGDLNKAVDYSRAAGERAVRLVAFEEAVRLYQMALDALGREAAPSDERRCELLLAQADARGRAGDSATAQETFLQAAEIARAANLPELLARAAVEYGGRFLWMRARSDERLVPLLEDALAALGEQDSDLRVRVLLRLANARGDASRERRERLCEQAVAAARRLGDPATLAYALDAAEAALHGPMTAQSRLSVGAEIVALAQGIGDRERLFDGHEHCFWAAWELGDPDRRADELAAITTLADELGQPAQLWMTGCAHAMLALSSGRFGEAEDLVERAARVGAQAVSWNATAAHKLHRFLLARERGELEGLEADIRDAGPDLPSPLVHGAVHAYICAASARFDDAAGLAEITRHDLADWHVNEEWLVSICLLAEVCSKLNDTARAGQLYDLIEPYGSLNAVAPPEMVLGSAGRSLGVLATVLGHFDDAERHFDAAVRMNQRMGARPWAAHAQHDFAQMLLVRNDDGDTRRAAELLESAVATYRALDMKRWAESARKAERAAQDPPNRRS